MSLNILSVLFKQFHFIPHQIIIQSNQHDFFFQFCPLLCLLHHFLHSSFELLISLDQLTHAFILRTKFILEPLFVTFKFLDPSIVEIFHCGQVVVGNFFVLIFNLVVVDLIFHMKVLILTFEVIELLFQPINLIVNGQNELGFFFQFFLLLFCLYFQQFHFLSLTILIFFHQIMCQFVEFLNFLTFFLQNSQILLLKIFLFFLQLPYILNQTFVLILKHFHICFTVFPHAFNLLLFAFDNLPQFSQLILIKFLIGTLQLSSLNQLSACNHHGTSLIFQFVLHFSFKFVHSAFNFQHINIELRNLSFIIFLCDVPIMSFLMHKLTVSLTFTFQILILLHQPIYFCFIQLHELRNIVLMQESHFEFQLFNFLQTFLIDPFNFLPQYLVFFLFFLFDEGVFQNLQLVTHPISLVFLIFDSHNLEQVLNFQIKNIPLHSLPVLSILDFFFQIFFDLGCKLLILEIIFLDVDLKFSFQLLFLLLKFSLKLLMPELILFPFSLQVLNSFFPLFHFPSHFSHFPLANIPHFLDCQYFVSFYLTCFQLCFLLNREQFIVFGINNFLEIGLQFLNFRFENLLFSGVVFEQILILICFVGQSISCGLEGLLQNFELGRVRLPNIVQLKNGNMFEVFPYLLVFMFLYFFQVMNYIMKARNFQQQLFYLNSMLAFLKLCLLIF